MTSLAGGLDVSVSAGKDLDGALQIALSAIAHTYDLARLSWNDDVVVTRRTPQQKFGPALVTPPPGAFLQATPQGEKALLESAKEAVGNASKIADLFAGCGTFSLPLAMQAQVHAVEGSAAMMQALDHGWRHGANMKRVTTETRDLFRRPLMVDELAAFDAVVIDPPRAGAEAQVAQLAQSNVARIAFMSCNPITFSRDAKVLVAAGWSLDWVQVVDQFRWSPHVELAAQFTRA
ncbi:class I SAM-dependent RNA methyltransferase [Aliiroseovarius sp. PTFE2010]|uniref:class I SAM-dependent RNA methyltransferase n=1 Tax=Aliiroseovarius sp. PTFE2010 TaxID=3417190 RepID=UPI003CF0D0F6